MKKDTHPTYYKNSKTLCSCGKTHEIGSTREKMEVEICSNCHPFFTGQERLVDTAGRVEKFKARRAKAELTKASIKSRSASKRKPKIAKTEKIKPTKKPKKTPEKTSK
ncbi:MAG: 50S ribosomal protein L31 [Candidatus Colwellbacteria bacterium CG10_big_fil_rev_8_21_14_0_10_42_22]|uniref:Large ribosomal subunit protein bL31 n=1 Tax=Candidatus Colwellbacteria bacterium CG10_big_fil_rev_8_21_14_0_10_42_22 TaxID=1974540 RepID=A0A2H0VGG5_9BACT|nr:MAG: 50S ribosomal protein L31 [Candidatus Colwellbacteria bacterium CG10_big_fil_rev_8_21_14_0_10_42_22]